MCRSSLSGITTNVWGLPDLNTKTSGSRMHQHPAPVLFVFLYYFEQYLITSFLLFGSSNPHYSLITAASVMALPSQTASFLETMAQPKAPGPVWQATLRESGALKILPL